MITKPEDTARIGATASKSDPKTTADAMVFIFTNDLRPDLAKITVPILVIVADTAGEVPRDRLEAAWRAQVDAVPKHELAVVEHSKHFVMLDQPDAFYAALDKFIFAK